MKLSILISPDRIVDLKSRTKSDVLKEMFRVIERSPDILNRNAFEKSLIERENILTTGIGNEIAIPHVQTDVVKGMVIAIGRCQEGVDFDSLDGKPVKIVIMIASSNQQPRTDFLKVLAKIVKTFREESFRRKILKAKDPQGIIALLESS